ncbi:MAG TPA: UbiA prenyltransferase family protein [Candidatus Saccharimonadales bacterium]|nr:UbiA prenyltransferase family protein [Candidatus Saccharimonadales bacterium]
MRYLRLLFHMIRYKSALVLVLFMTLSSLIHDPVISHVFKWQTLIMAVALVLVYACATCINDLADWKIDRVNLKGHADRPLVTGEGSRKDLIILGIIAAMVAISLALLINPIAVIVVLLGLVLNAAYSLRPLRISHRPILTPFYLALCYVLVAYLAGFAVVFAAELQFNWLYLSAFYFLFLARISLKDFRDRKGDALAGKPTLILKYGKTAVCMLSSTAVAVGSILLMMAVNRPYLQVVVGGFAVCLLVIEYRLYRSRSELHELLSVGYSARVGNGISFALLGTLVLEASGAATSDIVIFYASLVLLYAWMVWDYVKHPESFYFGKKKVV